MREQVWLIILHDFFCRIASLLCLSSSTLRYEREGSRGVKGT